MSSYDSWKTRDDNAPQDEPDYDDERKARLEEADRLASQVRDARELLEPFRDIELHDEWKIQFLMSAGTFSRIEAREALDEIAWQDGRA